MEKTLAQPAINWRDTVRHWLIRWLAGSDLVVTNASTVEVVLSPGQKMFAHGCGFIGLSVDQARAEAYQARLDDDTRVVVVAGRWQ